MRTGSLRLGRPGLALLLVAVAMQPAIAAVSVGSAAQSSGAFLSISDVSVDPQRPEVGEPTKVTVTVRNSQSSSEAAEITDVAIRVPSADQVQELVRIEDLGDVTPGNELSVPLTVQFSDAGYKILRVHVWGRDESGNRTHLQYPLTVDVRADGRADDASLLVSSGPAVAGVERPVNVTVVNPLTEAIRNVEVDLSGRDVRVVDDAAVDARIPAGTNREYTFEVVASRPGTHAVTARLRYVTQDGEVVTEQRALNLSVEPLEGGVAVSASVGAGGEETTVEVSNLANVPIEDLTVRVRAASGWSSLDLVERIDPHSETTVAVDTSPVAAGTTLDVDLDYTLGGVDRRNHTTVTLPENESSGVPARIELTGIDVEREDGRVHVTGSASNLGGTDAESVVVSVVATGGVEPAFPGRRYFVGAVPSSDFAAFDVYARVDGNVSTIPLEVSYLVDDDREEHTVSVPYDDGGEAGVESSGTGSGSGTVWLVLGGVVVVGVAVIIGVAWRNARVRD